jgi:hypothetical protein
MALFSVVEACKNFLLALLAPPFHVRVGVNGWAYSSSLTFSGLVMPRADRKKLQWTPVFRIIVSERVADPVRLADPQSEERHIRLTDIMVQNLFPAIDVDSVKLSQCRRVVLFRRDPDTGSFDLRHYVVNVKAAGLTRGIKKIVRRRKIPNLSRYDDIGEYVTGGGASDSEGEDGEDERVQIEAGQKAIDGSRGARHNKVFPGPDGTAREWLGTFVPGWALQWPCSRLLKRARTSFWRCWLHLSMCELASTVGHIQMDDGCSAGFAGLPRQAAVITHGVMAVLMDGTARSGRKRRRLQLN